MGSSSSTTPNSRPTFSRSSGTNRPTGTGPDTGACGGDARRHIPTVLGYIVASAIIGPGILSLTGDVEGVAHVAEFGVVILLFLIGLEVRPALLWQMKHLTFGLGMAQMASVSVALGAFIAHVPLAETEFRQEIESDIEEMQVIVAGFGRFDQIAGDCCRRTVSSSRSWIRACGRSRFSGASTNA